MTPIILQDRLVAEMKSLFKGKTLKNENGEQSAFTVYSQWLPAEDPNVDSQKNMTYFPFIRVKLSDGNDLDEESANRCSIEIEIGIFDDNTTYQGHRDLVNIIYTIYRHLMKTRTFGAFEVAYPFKWSIHPDNNYPKFYAMIETVWNVPKITINDTLS